jgi:hypothetical protein
MYAVCIVNAAVCAVNAFVRCQFGGGAILLRQSASDALPSMATGGIIVFVTGELAQGAGVRTCTHTHT